MKLKFLPLLFVLLLTACRPATQMDLAGEAWRVDSLHTNGSTFAFLRGFELPSALAGKPLELIVDQNQGNYTLMVDAHLVPAVEQDLLSFLPGVHHYRLYDGLAEGRHGLVFIMQSDSTQHTLANALPGQVTLRVLPKVTIDRVEVHPDASLTRLDISLALSNNTKQFQQPFIDIIASPDREIRDDEMWRMEPVSRTLEMGTTVLDFSMRLPANAPHWSEAHPDLLCLYVYVETEGEIDEKEIKVQLK